MPARRRTNFSKAVREQALDRAGGRCEALLDSGERCPADITRGGCIFDHVQPDRIGGRPTLDNCQVLCPPCDKAKFRTDMPAIAKTRRVEARFAGTACPSRPMAGSRFDRITKGLDGRVRDRETGAVRSRPAAIDVRSL